PYKEKKFGKFFELSLEKKILKHSKLVTGISKIWKKELTQRFSIDPDKIKVLYNGWDESDYQNVNINKNEDKFIFSYIGNFYTLRTAKYFIEAIEELDEENKLPDHVIFRFVGNYFPREKKLFANSKVSHLLEIIPQVTHSEAIKYQFSSDVLLLFISSKSGAFFITGKVFEYLRTQKTILAMIPNPSEVRDIISQAGHNFITTMEDVVQIKKTVLQIISSKQKKYTIPFEYTRENQTKRLIKNVEKM
ncbi:MAG: hypothetical protein U9N34_09895, partial [Candidatus Cloacimonadota bacterium]|nr:hypothetical protein [Candidatus Cloacimonadota bacterium]